MEIFQKSSRGVQVDVVLMQGSFEEVRGGNGQLSVLREHIGPNHWIAPHRNV
jgi:hypothetical protein